MTPCSRHQFARAVNGNSYLATRFTDKPPNKYESLIGHTGCVNTVVWNEAGDLILSGSGKIDFSIRKRIRQNEWDKRDHKGLNY